MSPSSRTTRSDSLSADYVSSGEALVILGVKPQTLYSYASRGLVRRISPQGRTSFYNREDLQRLRARADARSGHGAVAESAMHWGEPVLVTGITEITPQGPRYRQHLALDLVRDDYQFEAVAEYLWTGVAPTKTVYWPIDGAVMQIAPHLAEMIDLYPDLHIRQLLMEAVLLLSIAHGRNRTGAAGAFSIATARALIQVMCGTSGFLGPSKNYIRPSPGESIASVFARAFEIAGSRRQLSALNATFVLLADHEFTPATFAARIAASTGADLYSCIGAALQVQFGSALGLQCDRVEKALRWRRNPLSAAASSGMCNAPNLIPVGFSHPLYTDGDPRAKKILELALGLDEHADAARAVLDKLKRIDNSGGNLSLDAALVVFCHALGIDKPVAGGLLALSRACGWIAHVAEQRQQDFMIRPRGRFRGGMNSADIRAA